MNYSFSFGALFQVRTDTPFKLNYYVETVAGTGAYELYKSVTHTATTDAYIPAAGLISRTKADLGDMDGLKLRYDLLPSQVTIHGDGSGNWFGDCDSTVIAWDKETTLYAQWEKID